MKKTTAIVPAKLRPLRKCEAWPLRENRGQLEDSDSENTEDDDDEEDCDCDKHPCRTMNLSLDIGNDVPETAKLSFKLRFLPLNSLPTAPPKPKNTKGKISREGADALSQDMATMMKDANIADLTIKCDGKEFFAHKFMLSARSSVFAAMFSHKETKECETGEVDVTDCEGDIMEVFLQYIYTGNLPEATFEMAEKLVNIAAKYNVKSLTAACTEILAAHLGDNNAIRVAIVADLYSIDGLKKDALDTITASKKPLKTMNGWKDLNEFHDLKTEILDCKAT